MRVEILTVAGMGFSESLDPTDTVLDALFDTPEELSSVLGTAKTCIQSPGDLRLLFVEAPRYVLVACPKAS
jgi:hypothetical protein